MKKRLLITSIVMMLVVAVALSTATYAWFTSNSGVTASTVTLTAATNDAAALGISWTNSNYGTEIIDAVSGTSATLIPMTPIAYTVGTTVATADTENKIAFNTATIRSDATENALVFGADGSTAIPYVWNDGEGSGKGHTSFFVKNLAPANTTNLTVTITANITGHYIAISSSEATDTTNYDYFDAQKAPIATPGENVSSGFKVAKSNAKDLVRVAIFVNDTLLTVLANDTATDTRAKVAKGAITSGTPIATYAAGAADATSATTGATFTLNANTSAEIVVMMWLDGALFDETRSTETADIALSFNGEKITA